MMGKCRFVTIVLRGRPSRMPTTENRSPQAPQVGEPPKVTVADLLLDQQRAMLTP